MKAAEYRDAVSRAMREDDLDEQIRALAVGFRMLRYHTHDSRRSPSGFPDLVLVGRRGLLFRELKRETAQPTAKQREWLDSLAAVGADTGLWRPSDLTSGRILRELRAAA
jgi:hypothetical protein